MPSGITITQDKDWTLPGLESTRSREAGEGDQPYFDVMLGNMDIDSPQYGVVGTTLITDEQPRERVVAFDFNHVHCMSLFGAPGGGKSYTLGTIMEMACQPIAKLNQLPSPLCVMMFHYSASEAYEPEFVTMVEANYDSGQVKALKRFYGADPRACDDVLLLAPKEAVQRRREEFPGLRVEPLAFHPNEIQIPQWRILMGAVGEKNMYINVLKLLMKQHRFDLSVDILREGIHASKLEQLQKDLAGIRLDVVDQFIDPACGIQKLIKPGRMIIVDLRDEFMEKDEVFALLIVLMQVFGDAKSYDPSGPYQGDWYQISDHNLRCVAENRREELIEGDTVNKLVCFDEAHKFMDDKNLVKALEENIREMRHKACSILVASQDPPSIPYEIMALSTHLILHKMASPQWLAHIKTVNACLEVLRPYDLSTLNTGEGWVWATKGSELEYTTAPVKMKFRPRASQHGGATKTAVKGTETKGI
jgi:DNA phosphorothioation-dependent restriction protein DptH